MGTGINKPPYHDIMHGRGCGWWWWWWQQTREETSFIRWLRAPIQSFHSNDKDATLFNYSILCMNLLHRLISSFASPKGNCNGDAMRGTSWIGKSMCVLLIRNSWRHTCTTRTAEIVFCLRLRRMDRHHLLLCNGWCFWRQDNVRPQAIN